MVRVYTAAQIRAAEAPYLKAGVPLMQRAADGLAAAIAGLHPTSVLLLVGAGNNGADAMWSGARLAAAGVDVVIVPTTDHPNPGALDAALNAGAQLRGTDRVVDLFLTTDVIVDGILGIGTNASPALRGTAREVVEAVLAAWDRHVHPIVVAVDIPSGVDPDDGSVPDPTVLRATLTVTFGGMKAGLFIEPAAGYAGEVRLVEVGIEGDLAALDLAVPKE
jgi:NAD(P)H-hydrate epimerase